MSEPIEIGGFRFAYCSDCNCVHVWIIDTGGDPIRCYDMGADQCDQLIAGLQLVAKIMRGMENHVSPAHH